MAAEIDHDKPYTDEEKAYLQDRGKYELIRSNERRFGGWNDAPPIDEKLGLSKVQTPENPQEFDDAQAGRNPNSVNAKDAIRENREQKAEAEKTIVGEPAQDTTPKPPPSGDELNAPDYVEGEIDEDIEAFADSLTIAQLKGHLDTEEPPIEYDAKAKHDELAETYANVLQDKRDAGEDLDLTPE